MVVITIHTHHVPARSEPGSAKDNDAPFAVENTMVHLALLCFRQLMSALAGTSRKNILVLCCATKAPSAAPAGKAPDLAVVNCIFRIIAVTTETWL